MSDASKVCAFFLEGRLFGVDVDQVQEVIRYQEMTRVPLAPDVVGGLINLRGQIVTAIDLRRRLGLGPLPAGKQPMNVVLRADGGMVSLLVDEIAGVLELANDVLEEPPATLEGPRRALIQGVYKLPGQLLLVLDAARATDIKGDVARSAKEKPREGGQGCVRL